MRAHFLLEEQVFFPALQGLYPEREAELSALMKDHEQLRALLRELIDRILACQFELAVKSVADCSAALLEHEAREELFVRALAEGGSD
jgi:iron-sulfur cluster repair protein YtfE (RIC family)